MIVHSFQVPFVFVDESDGKKYINVDGKKILVVPQTSTTKDILWFKKPYIGGKNEAFKIEMEWQIKDSSGKKSYTVKFLEGTYQCNCLGFRFSGNARTCKHINEIQKLN